jgi:hypothetical protein
MEVLSKYYKFSVAFAVFAVAFGFFMWGPQVAFVIAVLGILEISLSFDNAVVNARVLANWDEKWRQRFLMWGILIAVFGMRIVFPIAIVSITTGVGPIAVTALALNNPSDYAAQLTAVHHQVAGFGGAFLFMVALAFFFEEKTVYWLDALEERLVKLGQLEGVAVAITLIVSYFASTFFDSLQHGSEFFIAAVFGIVTYVIVHGVASILGDSEDGDGIIKAGVAGFLYLELIDSVFSFDGVIGAFVLTTYLPVIALGLGIGAFFVRSMTIHMVEAGTLAEYRYLEHGAFYAVLILAGIMFLSAIGIHFPEWFVGLLSVSAIGAAVWHSIVHNKRDAITS